MTATAGGAGGDGRGHGWDGCFVWDRLLCHDQGWDVAGPVAVVAARTARIGVLVNVLARRGSARWRWSR